MTTPAELLEANDLVGARVLAAGWLDDLRTFQLELNDGRALRFDDCLQVSYLRPPHQPSPPTIAAWWADEPSPLLASLSPELRLYYHHLVFELSEGTLRVACRELVLGPLDLADDEV